LRNSVEQKKANPDLGKLDEQPPLPYGYSETQIRGHLLETHPNTLRKLREKRIREGKDR
jgi:hypothetical protein